MHAAASEDPPPNPAPTGIFFIRSKSTVGILYSLFKIFHALSTRLGFPSEGMSIPVLEKIVF